MPEIKLEHVTKRWGKFYAVDDLDLVIQDNAFVTLLGPSGCGKTTTLRMIAGLETPTSGRITIGDQVVFDSALGINIPANKRKVGFLFQNYALWPNMTVYENISFGLKNIKEPLPKVDFEAKNAARLAEILEQPAEVVRVLEECRDKDGRLDQKKAQLKLVDTFTISIYTAKQLLSYRLEQSPDLSGEIASLRGRVEAARQSAAAAGGELDGEFRLVKGGQVITETRKLTREEIDLTVRRVARIVKIGMFMDRYPAELSGGQQQRVAIARTHDQMEAMTLATQICLIENGVLQQYDAPLTVYHQPNNLFVADFVGNPSINFVEAKGAQRADGAVELTVFQGRKALFRPSTPLDLPQWFRDRAAQAAAWEEAHRKRAAEKSYVEKGNKDEAFRYHIAKVVEDDDSLQDDPVLTDQDLVLGIRPEFLDIADQSPLEGEIYGAMPTGMESTIKVRVDDFLLTGVIFGSSLFTIGEKVPVTVSGDNIMLFHRKSGACIATGSLEL